jgi:hypothetical protein
MHAPIRGLRRTDVYACAEKTTYGGVGMESLCLHMRASGSTERPKVPTPIYQTPASGTHVSTAKALNERVPRRKRYFMTPGSAQSGKKRLSL